MTQWLANSQNRGGNTILHDVLFKSIKAWPKTTSLYLTVIYCFPAFPISILQSLKNNLDLYDD